MFLELPRQLSLTWGLQSLQRNALISPHQVPNLSSPLARSSTLAPSPASSLVVSPAPIPSPAPVPSTAPATSSQASRIPRPLVQIRPMVTKTPCFLRYLSPPTTPQIPYDALWYGLPAHRGTGPSAIIVGIHRKGPIWAVIDKGGGYPLPEGMGIPPIKLSQEPKLQHLDTRIIDATFAVERPTAIIAPARNTFFVEACFHIGGYPIPKGHSLLDPSGRGERPLPPGKIIDQPQPGQTWGSWYH